MSIERNLLFQELGALGVLPNWEVSFVLDRNHEISENKLAELRRKYIPILDIEYKKNNDPNYLTNVVFWREHPELKGRKLTKSDSESLKQEWRDIKNKFVASYFLFKGVNVFFPNLNNLSQNYSRWKTFFPAAELNEIEYIIDGDETFKNIVGTINTTKQGDFIYISGWMLDVNFPLIDKNNDTTLLALLKKAADKGVEVKVLVWDNLFYIGDKDTFSTKENIEKLNNANSTNIKAFLDNHTYSSPATKENLKKITDYLNDIKRICKKIPGVEALLNHYDYLNKIEKYLSVESVGAHHEKIIIVNAEGKLTGFCGGIDVNPNRMDATKQFFGVYLKDIKPNSLHDIHCKIKGRGAYNLLQKFILRWENHPSTEKIKLIGKNEPRPSPTKKVDAPYTRIVGTYNNSNKSKIRSLKHAYYKIIDNSNQYIYIEDQYGINLDVARKLNNKIRDPKFKKLILVLPDPELTDDILIPNQKREEFFNALYLNTTQKEKDKVALLAIDTSKAFYQQLHPGVHSKLLIADDEIAIIGSANLSQRSFTHDSETSIVVFDHNTSDFVKRLRTSIWNEYFRNALNKPKSWEEFASISQDKSVIHLWKKGLLTLYEKKNNDFDVKIINKLKHPTTITGSVIKAVLVPPIADAVLITSVAKILNVVKPLIWDYVIDPNADK